MSAPSLSYDSIRFRHETIEGVGIHYEEAGDRSRPTLVLLHGFPSTSRMWDRLIPALAAEFHVIAPDYPGFGLSDAPSPATFAYTFDHITQLIADLLDRIGVARCALLAQDYGGPIAFRMAMARPERLSALLLQNAAAYEVALGPNWETRRAYWANPPAHLAALQKNLLSLEAARLRHVGASPNVDRYDPNSWADEHAMLSRPGQSEIQSTLFYDYRTNVASYPRWQEWLREAKPPMLVVWGRYDTSFRVAGAECFARDNPNAVVHIINAGHFPLDEAAEEVGDLTMSWLRAHSQALQSSR
jgi:pimeloyl-ACP methyl ester carboxylesterase